LLYFLIMWPDACSQQERQFMAFSAICGSSTEP
jgi:hypothetical protein